MTKSRIGLRDLCGVVPLLSGGARLGVVVGGGVGSAVVRRFCLSAASLALFFLLSAFVSTPAFAEDVTHHEHNEVDCLNDAASLIAPPAGSQNISPIIRPLTSTQLRAIRLVVIASGDFTGGRSDAEVFDQIFSVLETANSYLRPLRLRLELAGVQAFQPGASDPYAEASARRDANAMLDLARAEWTGRSFPDHDLVAVFGRSSYRSSGGGSTFGLAYPSTVCLNKKFAFLFASQGGSGEAAELSFGATIAHEVGHSVGIDHDPKFYAEGPSLMAPSFAVNVNGFSETSLAEFADYEAFGGTACLQDIPGSDVGDLSIPGRLAFAGGSEQEVTVAEGERLRRSFQVAGNFPGVTYLVEGLPFGATFDKANGTIDFTPSFDLLRNKQKTTRFNVFVTALSFNVRAELLLRVNVTARNQAPTIGAEDGELTAGVRFRGDYFAADADAGDGVELKVVNKSALRKLPGKPKVSSSRGRASIEWTPPAGLAGAYPVLFSARDKSGAVTQKQIFLRVAAAEIPADVIAPDQVIAANGEPLTFSLELRGGNGRHELDGLEPGMFVQEKAGKIVVQFSPAAADEKSLDLKLVTSSRGGSLSRSVPVFLAKGLTLPGVHWPGGAGAIGPLHDVSGDGEDDVNFYNPLTGLWRHVGCSGNIASSRFGGLAGDLPIIVHRGGSARRAIFRSELGQGVWYIDDGSAPVRFGLSGDIPLAGDIDGDGSDELVVYRPRSGEWFSTSDGVTATRSIPFSFTTQEKVIPYVSDVDGDAKADFVRFRRTASGLVLFEARLADGTLLTAVVDKAGLSHVVTPFVLDRDGDGRADFGVQKAGGGVQWFDSVSGKLSAAQTAPVASQSIFAAQRCGGAGAALLAFDQLNAFELSELTPESAQLRAANSLGFGDLEASGATSHAVLRESVDGGSTQWISRTVTGAAAFYTPLPALFGYRTAMRVDSVFQSQLVSYGDGVWLGQKADGTTSIERWGQFGDVPVPGDYNGDGKTDVAIYRSTDSSWWILLTDFSGALREAKVAHWGRAGDVPVPADYDGDGATDIAIWRPLNGTWAIILADGRVRTQALGGGTDVPAPGDYAGTGRKELAVYRAATGSWIVQFGKVKETTLEERWGLGSDEPVEGDFDGDGRDDLAVWRESEGTWYLRNFGDLAGRAVPFGLPGDEPLGLRQTLRIF